MPRGAAPRCALCAGCSVVADIALGRQVLRRLRADRQRCKLACPPACAASCACCDRSDLTLVCSPEEMRLLVVHYGVPAHKLALAPFFTPPSPYAPSAAAAPGAAAAAAPQPCPGFAERRDFMMIGNFRHLPNFDSVQWTCSEVWPLLRRRLADSGTPDAQLHIYGSYAPGAAQRLHNPVRWGMEVGARGSWTITIFLESPPCCSPA